MRIPVEGHLTQPWRIHEIAPDFRVEDVWAYRTPGAGPDDFPAMLAALRAMVGMTINSGHVSDDMAPALNMALAVIKEATGETE